jgi:spore germination protein GerM
MQDQNQKSNRRISLGFVAGISLAVFVAGGIVAWWAFSSLKSSENLTIPTIIQPTSQPSPSAEEKQVQIYWLKTTENKTELAPIAITTEKSAQPQQVLESAFQRLLVGSNNPGYTTTIPQGTKLLGLTSEMDGVHLNLSSEFTTGGGSASMTGRLAQILYTATSLNQEEAVWINIEGKPLQELGGEGILVDQPMTRKSFAENFQF